MSIAARCVVILDVNLEASRDAAKTKLFGVDDEVVGVVVNIDALLLRYYHCTLRSDDYLPTAVVERDISLLHSDAVTLYRTDNDFVCHCFVFFCKDNKKYALMFAFEHKIKHFSICKPNP